MCGCCSGHVEARKGATIPEGEPRHERLQALVGAERLDPRPRGRTRDVYRYCPIRAFPPAGFPPQEQPRGIERAANAIAEKAAGIFLYARIACRTLQDTEGLDTDLLPADVLGAFVDDLTRRFGEQAGMVNDFLAALAWGEGKGLTRQVWAPMANALCRTSASYGDENVAWVLKHAGWHIIEAGEEGQAVHRLAHQLFADHYRSGADSRDANARITKALAAGTRARIGSMPTVTFGATWRATQQQAACWMRWSPMRAIWRWQTRSDLSRHSRLWLMARRGRSRTFIGASPTNFRWQNRWSGWR